MNILGEALSAAIMSGSTSLVTGTVTTSETGRLIVTHQGVPVVASWLDPVHAAPGDPVLMALIKSETGQSSAIVLGRVTRSPRPSTGKVEYVSGSTASVVTNAGAVQAVYAGSAPAVGDQVRLIWHDGRATAVGTVGNDTTQTGGNSPKVSPPAQDVDVPAEGTTVIRAVGCGSWKDTGARWTHDVVQGSGNGVNGSYGAWAYGAPLQALKGVTVVRAAIRLPGRSLSGNPSRPVTVSVRCHDQADAIAPPSAAGPSWTMALPSASYDWPADVFMPPAAAQWMVTNGGGLLINGAALGGVVGIDTDPTSGQLTIDWKRSS